MLGGLSDGQPVGAFDESSSVAQLAALEAEALFPEEEEVAMVAADTGAPLPPPPPPPEEEWRPPSDAYPTS